MLRELDAQEMEMVSGGTEDEIVVTAVRIRHRYDPHNPIRDGSASVLAAGMLGLGPNVFSGGGSGTSPEPTDDVAEDTTACDVATAHLANLLGGTMETLVAGGEGIGGFYGDLYSAFQTGRAIDQATEDRDRLCDS